MLKKYIILLTMLLALPAFANAWTLNAKAAAGGTISPVGNKAYASGVASDQYTVTPTGTNRILRVTLDGQPLTETAPGKYVAPYAAGKSWRYMVAYFTGASTFKITATATGDGAVREDTFESLTRIAPGAARQILVIPSVGNTAAVTASGVLGTDYTITNNADGTTLVSYTNISADQTVSAAFTKTPVFNVSAGPDVVNAAPGLGYKKTLFGSANSNQGAITYAWTVTGGPSGWANTQLVFDTPTAAVTLVSGASTAKVSTTSDPTASTGYLPYTVTLTAISGGVTKTSTAKVVVLDGKAAQLNQCAVCHSNNTPTIVADYTAGAHGTASGHTTGTCARCHSTEAAIAGFASGFTGGYTDVVGNAAAIAATWTPVAPAVSAAGIACAVCHTHDGLRPVNTYVNSAVVAWDPNGNGKVDQYDVCTGCHSLTNNAGALVGNYHDGSTVDLGRTISDTHYNNAQVTGYVVRKNGETPCADCHNLHKADVEIQDQWSESGHAGKIKTNKDAAIVAAAATYYDAPAGTDVMTVLRPTSTRTYYADYMRTTATSPAQGTVLTNPAPLVARAAGVTATSGAAWEHYNWDQTTSYGSCQKCHTATGAANYLTNPAAYDATGNGNDFSHLTGWTKAAGSTQNELLYCWGCHKSAATGELRNPGAIPADYKFQGASFSFPDVGTSNVCFACHAGRAGGGDVVALSTATPATNWTNVSFKNSHYMAAAGVMYVKAGYTNFVPPQTAITGATGTSDVSYGQSLTSDADMTVDKTGAAAAGKVSSTHRKLGTAAMLNDSHFEVKQADGTSFSPKQYNNPAYLLTGGPCAACHYASGDHTLEMGQVTLDAVCSKCHSAETGTTAAGLTHFIEEEGVEPFQAALALAVDTLKKNYNITYDSTVNPYFFDDTAFPGQPHASATQVKNWTRGGALTNAEAEKLMGACFNLNLLKRDPAAYAHARTYARRLLYDSIDFLDNKAIDQSVGTTALASGLKDALNNDLFSKGALAYTDSTLTTKAPGTSAGMLYILGWSRTTGAWNAWERP